MGSDFKSNVSDSADNECWTAKYEVLGSNPGYRADISIEISAACAPLGALE